LIAVLLAEPVAAASREVIKTGWNGFQEQVSARKLTGHSVRITLQGGGVAKTNLLQATPTGLVVRETRETKQWNSEKGKSTIPNEQVVSVRFAGRVGHKRLIGALAGLGGGAAIGAAFATGSDLTEGVGVILIPVGAASIAVIGAVVGYFVGRAFDRPAPEFVIER
jgi:RNase P/RNase MRP subunit p29